MTREITTVSGKFYAGMTRDEANEKKLVKKNIFQKLNSIMHTSRCGYATFDDIDLNKDGVLQGAEICAERDLEASDKKVRKWGSLILGTMASLAAPALIINPATAIILAVGITGLFAYGLFAKDGSEEKQETELYRQEHLYKTA